MKKILSILLLTAMLTLAFAACNSTPPTENDESHSTTEESEHTHAFGEWSIVKNSTQTEEGIKERYCTCGEKQTATIAKLTANTEPFTSIQCKNELKKIYDDSISQKTVWFEEDGWIYARYFNGANTTTYFRQEKDGTTKEMWYTKTGSDYLYFNKKVTPTTTEKTFESISVSDYEDSISNSSDGFQYLEYAISLIENATNFEAIKTEDSNTVYQIKLTVNGSVENITITTSNGLITKYDHADYTVATYDYNKIITVPDKNEYNTSKDLSLAQCTNELTEILEKSKSQKTVRFEEDSWVYAYYFDGNDSFVYMSRGKEGKWNEEWLGKVGNEYLYFNKRTTAQGTTKIYEVSSKSEIDEYIANINEDIFQYLEDTLIDFIKDSTSFNCKKIFGANTVYQISSTDKYCTREFTVTVVDGIVTEMIIYEDGEHYVTVTYDYTSTIAMPNKNEYSPN